MILKNFIYIMVNTFKKSRIEFYKKFMQRKYASGKIVEFGLRGSSKNFVNFVILKDVVKFCLVINFQNKIKR